MTDVLCPCCRQPLPPADTVAIRGVLVNDVAALGARLVELEDRRRRIPNVGDTFLLREALDGQIAGTKWELLDRRAALENVMPKGDRDGSENR